MIRLFDTRYQNANITVPTSYVLCRKRNRSFSCDPAVESQMARQLNLEILTYNFQFSYPKLSSKRSSRIDQNVLHLQTLFHLKHVKR
eukprot:UN22584